MSSPFTLDSLSVFLGFLIGAVIPVTGMILKRGQLRNRFGSPLDGHYRLNWTTKQILAIFSQRAAQRWYEARVHVHCGILMSILCTVGIIYVVKISAYVGSDTYKYKKHYYCGFRSYDSLEESIGKDVAKFLKSLDIDWFVDGVFICGYNYVTL